MARPVCITGLGAASGFGVGVGPLWDALLEGRSAIAPVRSFDAASLRCAMAAEVPEPFSIRDFVPKHYRKATKVMARDIAMAVAATHAAVADAGLSTRAVVEEGGATTFEPARLACHIGAGLIAAELDELAAAFVTATDASGAFDLGRWGTGDGGGGGMNNLTPLWMLKYLPNMLACHVTILHDAQGPSNTITAAEASGLLSVGESRHVLERGHADAGFAGGAESKINAVAMLRLEFAGVLASAGGDADGSAVVRPYDPDSTGTVPGEGGGIAVLETLDGARARGARVYAEVAGFGAGQSPGGGDAARRARGLRRAIEAALRDAGVSPGEIDAVAPAATGWRPADDAERAALSAVFGERAGEVPTITVTPNAGNAVAGAGGLSLCAAAMALRHQTLPARVHAGSPAGLDAGRVAQRDARLGHVLVCTPAMGGHNAALVLRAA